MQSLVFLTCLFSKVIKEKPVGDRLDPLVKEGLIDNCYFTPQPVLNRKHSCDLLRAKILCLKGRKLIFLQCLKIKSLPLTFQLLISCLQSTWESWNRSEKLQSLSTLFQGTDPISVEQKSVQETNNVPCKRTQIRGNINTIVTGTGNDQLNFV